MIEEIIKIFSYYFNKDHEDSLVDFEWDQRSYLSRVPVSFNKYLGVL